MKFSFLKRQTSKSPSFTEAFETKKLIESGADETDMVINLIALKQKNYSLVLDDIKAVVKAAKGK
ncbi:unnamed protein product, partial [marine sediment metagenome]